MIGPSPMKLKGRIRLEDDKSLTFVGETHDGISFSLTVDQFDIEMNESFKPSKRTVDGWLFVQAEGKQNSIVYLTLPKSTITYGKQISVNEFSLMPRFVTVKDFGPVNNKKILAESKKVLVSKETEETDSVSSEVAPENKEFEKWIETQDLQ